MAKNNLSKILTGVAVIGAGVALGLAVYNKLDTIKRELNDDEFEDDFYEDDMEEDVEDDSAYVTINVVAPVEEDETADEAVEESKEDKDSK